MSTQVSSRSQAGRQAQLPAGVGKSRPPRVVETSGAGGASSPGMIAGVISAGAAAIDVAGFAAWKACWPAP